MFLWFLAVGMKRGREEREEFAADAPPRFEVVEKLGEGTYGSVYKARDAESGDTVAIKSVKCDRDEEGLPATAIREICLLRSLRHPNVVRLQEVIYNPKQRTLDMVMEYCTHDLRNFMKKQQQPVSRRRLKSYMYQLLSAVAYCHSRRIVHRDLKPQNILLGSDGTLKLADFGLSRCFTLHERAYTHEVVTLWYRAPEILLGATHYSTAVDVWSCGCLLFELATSKALFPGDCEIDQIFRVFRLLGTPTEESWPGVTRLQDFSTTFPQWPAQDLQRLLHPLGEDGADLLQSMLHLDPRKRISARDALEHPFFHDLVAAIPTTPQASLRGSALHDLASLAVDAATPKLHRRDTAPPTEEGEEGEEGGEGEDAPRPRKRRRLGDMTNQPMPTFVHG